MNDLQQDKNEPTDENNDGLDFYRGLVNAVAFYLILVALAVLGYDIWRYFR